MENKFFVDEDNIIYEVPTLESSLIKYQSPFNRKESIKLSEFETIESDYGNNDIDIQFFVPNQKYSIMRYNNKQGTLQVSNSLVHSLSSLFLLDDIESLDLIGNYMEKNFNFKITELDYLRN
jgi:hypothetical protein